MEKRSGRGAAVFIQDRSSHRRDPSSHHRCAQPRVGCYPIRIGWLHSAAWYRCSLGQTRAITHWGMFDMIEIAASAGPTTLEGEPLDHNSLHDWLALPVQHFIDKHPDKKREELIREACEVVAELV